MQLLHPAWLCAGPGRWRFKLDKSAVLSVCLPFLASLQATVTFAFRHASFGATGAHQPPAAGRNLSAAGVSSPYTQLFCCKDSI